MATGGDDGQAWQRWVGAATLAPWRGLPAALKRVWGIDIFECTRCGGKLTILAFIEKLSAVKAILDHVGLPSVPLTLTMARGPPQLALAW